jgi:hypothetical protein
MPDIQKWEWTTSGGACAHPRARQAPNRAMNGGSRSFGTGSGGPAGTCRTATPGQRAGVLGDEGDGEPVAWA